VAALIGVVIDVTGSHDYMAMLYPLRAFILCMIIVVLVRRWEQKSKANHSLVQ
jgi:fucose permease